VPGRCTRKGVTTLDLLCAVAFNLLITPYNNQTWVPMVSISFLLTLSPSFAAMVCYSWNHATGWDENFLFKEDTIDFSFTPKKTNVTFFLCFNFARWVLITRCIFFLYWTEGMDLGYKVKFTHYYWAGHNQIPLSYSVAFWLCKKWLYIRNLWFKWVTGYLTQWWLYMSIAQNRWCGLTIEPSALASICSDWFFKSAFISS
jgi:hypothetical protein